MTNILTFGKIPGVDKYDVETIINVANVYSSHIVMMFCNNREQLQWHYDLISEGFANMNLHSARIPVISISDSVESMTEYRFFPINNEVLVYMEKMESLFAFAAAKVKTKWTGFVEGTVIKGSEPKPKPNTRELTGPIMTDSINTFVYFKNSYDPIATIR